LHWSSLSRVAPPLKASVASYGLCSDEFGTQGGFSPQLYIRESRRLIGDFVMNENHMTLANGFTDEVALGYYTVDTHPVQNVIVNGQVKNEGPNAFNPPVGYKIPYRVLLPKTTECTNLLVTFCMSASHVAFSSMRVEPVLMALGQAAGIAASLAVHRGTPIQNISIRELKNKQDIYRTVSGRAIVLDVSGDYPNGFVSQTPPLSWDYRSSDFGYIGQGYLSDGNRGKGKALVFVLNIPEPGSYRVCIKYPTGSSIDAQRSHNVPVTINHAAGVTYLTLDQKSTGQGGDWDDLGVYPFDQGWPSPNKIVLTTTGTESFVVVNAVKLVKV
jgi:FAD dependent oxidoreductase